MNAKYPAGFSIEFFPPKTDKSMVQYANCVEKFSKLNPEYFSITYGAGGSTKQPTMAAVQKVLDTSHVPVCPHLSCVGETKEQLKELVQAYKDMGISKLVALRGDLPSGMGPQRGELGYAVDLVRFLREEFGDHFELAVAAYPEMHPKADSFDKDFQYFKEKVEAGADSAITQFFFNVDAYHFFVDSCQKAGIGIPVVPGIMPIYNYANLIRFADGCGAEVPRWIRTRMESYGDDVDSIKKFGEEVVTRLCEELIDAGCPGLHFYSLNKFDAVGKIWDSLKLSELGAPDKPLQASA